METVETRKFWVIIRNGLASVYSDVSNRPHLTRVPLGRAVRYVEVAATREADVGRSVIVLTNSRGRVIPVTLEELKTLLQPAEAQ